MVSVQNYQLLGNAIVKQAARDYERCLVADHACSTSETRRMLKELTRYFTGDLIKLHTKLDGIRLMNAIENQLIDYDYDLKALNKARHKRTNYYDED